MKKRKKLILIILLLVFMLHGPLGGVCLQTTVSCVSYLSLCTASVFSKSIRNDMKTIKYNPFNTSEEKVLNSNKVSFYKGVPIYKMNYNRSGSFCAILLYKNELDYGNFEAVSAVKHEWGHTIQQMILGPLTYFVMIGIPSFLELSNQPYYERPWEITADIFGGVKENHPHNKKVRGGAYLVTSLLTGPFGYFFLIGEY